MRVLSQAFQNTEYIPMLYGCGGRDINPPLAIDDVPRETRSLVLIVDDLDSPSGVFTHWLVWNIDPTTKEIGEDSVPPGASQGTNSFDKQEYRGPCHHFGAHRYFFKVFALNTRLKIDHKKGKTEIEEAMRGHIIEQAQIMGIYREHYIGKRGSKRDRTSVNAGSGYGSEPYGGTDKCKHCRGNNLNK